MTRTTKPTAGGILAATTAMQDPHHTYTRDQVAYLMHLAYAVGRIHGGAADIADTIGTWQEMAQPTPAREERVAARLAEMEHTAQVTAARQGRPYRIHPGGPVDWETGQPIRSLPAVAA